MIIKRIINIGLKGREIFQIEIHKKNNRISLYGCYPCDPSVLPDSYLECPTRSGMVKGTHHQGPHTGHYSWDSGTINNPEPRSRSSTTQESR